ncbi:MAG: hypothetical protein ABI778_06485, partial [Ignavibacteriota bacterium]
VHPEWYFMFLFQTLKIIPETIAILGFGLLFVLWIFVPILDRRARRGEKSRLFTYIGIAAICYICAMTAWAYFAVADEKDSLATEQVILKKGGAPDAK